MQRGVNHAKIFTSTKKFRKFRIALNGNGQKELLGELHKKFRKFDIDLFASNVYAKREKCISWFPDEVAYKGNMFTMDWE